MTDVMHNGRVTERVAGANDDLEALFAESARLAAERDGVELSLGGRVFEVWPDRFTHKQRMRILGVAGMTIEGAASNLDTAPVESMATLILASMAQSSGKYPGLDGIEAWIRQVMEDPDGDEVSWRPLKFDEAVESDPLGL